MNNAKENVESETNAQKCDINVSPLRLTCREARHTFARPILNAYGRWDIRRSIIVRLEDASGKTGYGEIAPVPDFPGAGLDACANHCKELGSETTEAALRNRELPPSMGFAFGSALAMMKGLEPRGGSWPMAKLLPPGPAALFEMGKAVKAGCRTFKYKLNGVPDATEREIVEMLLESLQVSRGKLRIDANGSIAPHKSDECMEWLAKASGGALDFVEQPFPTGQEDAMLTLMEKHGVAVALDESVVTKGGLDTWKNWPGPLVVKPALAGDPLKLRGWIAARKGRTVLSSALEGPVGLWGCLLCIGDAAPEPLGFSTGVWAEGDAWGQYTAGVMLESYSIGFEDAEAVWNSLSQ
ncbi:MAG: o-succinylbenzoate synthase [Opitutales bacterium]|nr:o-succinylbenzoate synthase [Opitutales bacterium]